MKMIISRGDTSSIPAVSKLENGFTWSRATAWRGFLEGKQKRTRNTLKRRVKKLREHGAGSLECIRVETEDQVDAFYESAFAVAEKSWQHKNLGRCLEETALYRNNLQSLAQLGALRAYLLKCGGIPCAFVIGYQYEDILQFEQTAFSSDFARFSPGTVLYYMMLEDLYGYRPPTIGQSRYRRHSAQTAVFQSRSRRHVGLSVPSDDPQPDLMYRTYTVFFGVGRRQAVTGKTAFSTARIRGERVIHGRL